MKKVFNEFSRKLHERVTRFSYSPFMEHLHLGIRAVGGDSLSQNELLRRIMTKPVKKVTDALKKRKQRRTQKPL
jgi:hypothetical protein